MDAIVPLGLLEKVPLRKAWPDEAENFTPWLSKPENLNLLSHALGIPLEFEANEKEVGAFAADILAKEPDSGRWVLIENQIAPTDHKHLGQLLTYAAGLEAQTIIWIAETFRDEHRAAIDFLNRATTDDYNFFGVQIELYRIGNSPFAPQFTIVAKPNDWSKQGQSVKQSAEGEQTEIKKLSREYWTILVKAASGKYQALADRTPYGSNYQTFESLRGGNPSLALNAAFPWDKSLRVEVYIDGSLAKAAFHALSKEKDKIEKAFGMPLTWEELPGKQASRIAFYMPGNEKRENRDRWAAQHEWMLNWGKKLADAARPFVIGLDPSLLKIDSEN